MYNFWTDSMYTLQGFPCVRFLFKNQIDRLVRLSTSHTKNPQPDPIFFHCRFNLLSDTDAPVTAAQPA